MKTLAGHGRAETEIKRSRFVAHCGRVESLADTLAFYEAVVDPAATHNCWAWRLGTQYRFNDDGEPGGTAGKPILAVIDGRDLDQVMVVVTRYYGGTKLGVGGLVRAYSGAASRAMDQAGTLEIHPSMNCRIKLPFAEVSQAHHVLDSLDAQKLSENYRDDGIEIEVQILKDRYEQLKSRLRNSTRGTATVSPLEE